MTLAEWVQIIGIGTNLAVLITAARVVRYISQIEFKVNTMWVVFMRKFGERKGEEDVS